ncbi:MAG: cbb3-type cytochrome c oxidase subunit I [Xanthomonadales bacterium]|nr:cbb3-type cytochrome c oxidase subunit I [Xanthomonadales bacterium]
MSLTNSITSSDFSLDSPGPVARRLAIGWLTLALSSLVIGGIFTILIVLSRTPWVQDFIPWVDFFHIALVVHVDMTVLVWFLSFAGVFWSINSSEKSPALAGLAQILCFSGTIVIALSPFFGAGDPLMNNYVPVLQHPMFFVGLGLFGLGFSVLVLHGLMFSRPVGRFISSTGAQKFGLYTALIIAFISIFSLLASWYGMPEFAQGQTFFELLFWGSGHTIQFIHVQLMLVAWMWLATCSSSRLRLNPRLVLVLFALGLLPALLTPLIYVVYEVGSAAHLLSFTSLMQFGGGLAVLPLALMVVIALIKSGRAHEDVRAERNALVFSIILFGVGGIIGFMIQGSNVTVPAHYHGSIVAVTLAYMGVTYHLLPVLGFKKPTGKMVSRQPIIYGVGQLMHVFGLAWSGGYGVQRKTAGSDQGLEGIQQIAGMGIMGLGGLIAIIGGVLFLVIVIKAMWPQKVAI